MLFFWGVLSILQACYLPGAILVAILFVSQKWYEKIILAFGLSLVLNYVLVLILTIAGIYVRPAMLALVCAEIVIYFYLISRARPRTTRHSHTPPKYSLKLAWALGGGLVLAVIVFVIWAYTFKKAGTIFQAWDAVVSWNRWARDWASNQLPHHVWHYPQLLPATWSVSYVLQGHAQLQFFPAFMCLLFMPMAAHTFLVLYIKSDKIAALIAALLFIIGAKKLQIYAIVGYADFPVAVMLLIAYSCLAIATQENVTKRDFVIYAIFGLLIAAGAGVTKQGGIFGYIVYVILLINSWRNNSHYRPFPIAKICPYLILTMILVFSWYAVIRWRISSGLEHSEIGYVTDGIHQGRNYWQRIIRSMRLFPLPWYFAAIALPGLLFRRTRILAISGVVFTILWGCFWSYDSRNFSPALPCLALAIGGWFSQVPAKTKPFLVRALHITKNSMRYITCYKYFIFITTEFIHKRKIKINIVLIIIFFGTLLLFQSKMFQNDSLISSQYNQSLNLGDININKSVINSFSEYGPGIILSNYQFLSYIPGIGPKNFWLIHFEILSGKPQLKSIEDFRQSLKEILKNMSIRYILVPEYAYSEINAALLDMKIQNTPLKIDAPGWRYLMMCRAGTE